MAYQRENALCDEVVSRLGLYQIKENPMDEEKACCAELPEEYSVPEFEDAMNAVYSAWREMRAKPDSQIAARRFDTMFDRLEQSKYQEKRRIWDELEQTAKEGE